LPALRDIFVTLVVFLSLPMILARPYYGILVWSWLSYMNPHKLSWGFAHDFPFAQIVAITTILAMLVKPSSVRRIPWTRESVLLLLFTLWMFITTWFAFNPDGAWPQWNKVWKIQLFTFITMMLIDDRKKIDMLIMVMVVSIGLYGVKGGIFTVLTGGAYAVYGPGGTFIGGNNEIGLAMIMTIPWMRYIQLTDERRWVKNLVTIAIILTTIAILGTRSRGALVGSVVMFSILFSKNLKNLGFVVLFGLFFYVAIQFMPQDWQERMGTISTSTSEATADQSVKGRFNAWGFAFNMAKDNPLTGGGFESFRPWLFKIYAPEPDNVHDAHSIYFEVLGEHGFVGLAMFLMLGAFSLLTARKIIKAVGKYPDLEWMKHLASMMQVSLIGYAVTGAALGLAYFDFYYALIAILVATKVLLDKELAERTGNAEIPGRPGFTAMHQRRM
jgi:probable O-glycosylation ligase (exosortase A-associated)